MPHFFDKIFFLGLLAIPALVAIYFLFRHSQKKIVSSLLLWKNQLKSRKSGVYFKRLPLPRTFLLEALAVCMLILAAAQPFLPRQGAGAITLVLDNSYSMRACVPSARSKALKKLNDLLSGFKGRQFRIILAGENARNIGVFRDQEAITHALKQWDCNEVNSDLKESIVLARKLAGQNNQVIVLTDATPDIRKAPDNTRIFAFGRGGGNLAIVNAIRSTRAGRDQCLVIVANLSKEPVSTEITLSFADIKQKPIKKNFSLQAMEHKKLSFSLPRQTGNISISLPQDTLNFDNKVVMLPEAITTIRTKINFKNKHCAKLVKQALAASGKVVFNAPSPQLLISDNILNGQKAFFRMKINIPKQGKSQRGPFTVNHCHNLTNGLNLRGVIWGCGIAKMPGDALIIAGKKTLMSIAKQADSGSDIYLNYIPKQSTVQDTPNWPIMFWNIIDLLIDNLGKTKRKNYRLGENIMFKFAEKYRKINLHKPDGNILHIPIKNGYCSISPGQIGIYTLGDGKKKKYDFSVNALNYEESNLLECTSGSLKGTLRRQALQENYLDIKWIFLLIALILLAWDWFLIRRTE